MLEIKEEKRMTNENFGWRQRIFNREDFNQ